MVQPNQHQPEVITRSSLTVPAPGAGEVPGAGPGPFDEWEGFFRFLERFEGYFSRIVGMIERVKSMESGGAIQGNFRVVGDDGPEQGPGPSRGPEPIPAIKAYQAALGLLAGLPEDTTVKSMLEFARGNKDMVLGQLDEHLKKLQEGG